MAGFSCDFHIHSTLSPCGSLEMSPKNIVMRAKEVGLDAIAVTDHNMTENSYFTYEVGRKSGTIVFFGMELQTEEEIHLLALFDDFDVALRFQKEIRRLLPEIPNDPEFYGDQVVVDENDEIVRFEERLLLNSAGISISDATEWVKSEGGVAIPSHIDSPTFSIISQLGFVPEGVPFDALEIINLANGAKLSPYIMARNLPLVTFSDAHYLKEIGQRRVQLSLGAPTCREVEKALKLLGAGPPGATP